MEDGPESTEKKWSTRKRILVYSCSALVAILVGAIGAGIWFLNEYKRVQEMSAYVGREMVCDSKDPEALKLLFVGNSLLFCYSMPFQLADIYKNGKPERPLKIYQVVAQGETLGKHLEHGNFERVLSENGPFNYVIIQAASYEPTYHAAVMRRDLALIIRKVKSKGAEPILFMTWADKGDYKSQKVISRVYKSLGKDFGIKVISDGDLFFEAQKDFPSMNVYMQDNHHQNATGSYLGALLTYSRLTGKSITGAPAKISIKEGKEVSILDLNQVDHGNCINLVKDFLKKHPW